MFGKYFGTRTPNLSRVLNTAKTATLFKDILLLYSIIICRAYKVLTSKTRCKNNINNISIRQDDSYIIDYYKLPMGRPLLSLKFWYFAVDTWYVVQRKSQPKVVYVHARIYYLVNIVSTFKHILNACVCTYFWILT